MVEKRRGVVVVGVGIGEGVDLVVVGDGGGISCQVVSVVARVGAPVNSAGWA